MLIFYKPNKPQPSHTIHFFFYHTSIIKFLMCFLSKFEDYLLAARTQYALYKILELYMYYRNIRIARTILYS